MTNLQAIKQRVNYPLSDIQAEEKLLTRGVNPTDTFSKEVADKGAANIAHFLQRGSGRLFEQERGCRPPSDR